MTKKSHLFTGIGIVLCLAGAARLHTSHTTPATSPPRSPAAVSSASKQAVPTPPRALATAASAQPPAAATERKTAATATVVTKSGKTYPLRRYTTLSVNDPYGNQWWTQGTGLDTAWTSGAGSTPTTVAVIDTGFALQHEDLAGRWALNAGEQGAAAAQNPSQLNCTDRGMALDQSCNLIDDDYDGIVDNESGTTTKENPSRLNCTDQSLPLNKSCNLIDDDNNGYVDDVRGWDFANFDNNVQAGEINPNGTSTTHGTEVSGVLAATGNNGKGIAGVNWTAKILPLQALDDDGYGDTLTVSRAIRYAADRHVDVISISLGTASEDPYLRQAVQYALSKGSVVVAASGNDGCDCISYPARYPEVFAVGAESSQGGPDSFSSYGDALDILAPGDDITTSTWSPTNPTSSYASGVAGTSFATPYVSGLLSLARSYQPQASWAELTNALLAEAKHTGLSASNPFSPTLGSGYAEADTLLSRVKNASSPAMRYYLSPLSATQPLSSSLTYQCQGTDFPTATIYKLGQGNAIRYTISQLEQADAADTGWTVTSVGRSCVGLPTDTPNLTRMINLFSEIDNAPTTKPTPSG